MKALTICQPYAELIARGEKMIENRRWGTSYRGPLAIHAGKSREWLGDDDEEAALYAVDVQKIAFGAVVAVADLIHCVPVNALPEELAGNEHANGPWCWILGNIRRLPAPIPYRGAQGLWNFDMPEVT
jgi:hypothetical protein